MIFSWLSQEGEAKFQGEAVECKKKALMGRRVFLLREKGKTEDVGAGIPQQLLEKKRSGNTKRRSRWLPVEITTAVRGGVSGGVGQCLFIGANEFLHWC